MAPLILHLGFVWDKPSVSRPIAVDVSEKRKYLLLLQRI